VGTPKQRPSELPSYEDYVKLWKAVMMPLLGWTAGQVELWAEQFKKYFDDRNIGSFHNDGPIMYVADEFITRQLRDWVREEHRGQEIKALIWGIDGLIGDFIAEVGDREKLAHADWTPVKEKIDAVLRGYGETFEQAVTEKRGLFLH
jgi:hypothetical protein